MISLQYFPFGQGCFGHIFDCLNDHYSKVVKLLGNIENFKQRPYLLLRIIERVVHILVKIFSTLLKNIHI